jgi:host factor-I protein
LSTPPQAKSGSRAPEATFEEAKYLKQLIESGARVKVKMEGDEEVEGVIEYYDQSFIRLTRDGEPNLFIFKHDIKYIEEAS